MLKPSQIVQVLLTLLYTFFVRVGFAQSYDFRHYQVEEGLSHNTVFCCAQDKRGFLWMGTKDGLNRFDGYNFKAFRNEPGDSLSIGDNFIRSLHIDKADVLYAGTRNGVYRYDALTETFRTLFSSVEEVREIKKDAKGLLWFIAGQTLYQLNENLRRLQVYAKANYFAATSICIYGEQVWVSTADGFLQQYEPATNGFISCDLFTGGIGPGSKWVEKIFATKDGKILAGTSNFGVRQIDLQTKAVSDLLIYGPDKTAIYARDFIHANNGELWMATESGIFILDPSSGKITNLRKQYDNPFSISDNAVYSLTRDAEGGIWAGTYFGGINYYPRQYAPFEKILPANNSHALSGNAVREICQDRFGSIWVGTEDAGLNKLDKRTGTIVHYSPGSSGLSYPNIHGLLARNDELWIGTFEHGLDVLDIKTGKVIRHYPKNNNRLVLKSNFIVVLYETRNKEIYIGTRQGLYRFNEKIDDFERVEAVPQESFVHSILEDKHGTLWVGTLGKGLYYVNAAAGKTGNFSYDVSNRKGLASNSVTTIFERADGSLWVGTEGGGLCRFNAADSSFTSYTSRQGFPSNTVFRILEDERKMLWITTSKGLVCFDVPGNKLTIYTTTNGLLSNQFNYNSGFRDSSGNMYFGSAKGLVSFRPATFIQNNFVPPVYITALLVNNQEFPVQVKGLRPPAISFTKKMELSHDQSSFSIDFAALSFTAPEMMEYMYIMEGLDKDWTYLKTNRKVYFTNLSPGSYTFKVKAANNSGKWSDKTAQLIITILPSFWASPLAYFLYILTGAGIVYFLFRIYHDRLNERTRRKIELLEHEKEKEIYQAKIEFFTNVAHEIKTPLTLIKAPMEKIIRKEGHNPEVEQNLKIMERNTDRLVELTNQLLDFRKIETTGFQLSFVEVNINELLLERFSSFKPLADQKNIQFTITTPREIVVAFIDTDAMQKILNNLIYNALAYCKAVVEIELYPVKETSTHFSIEVRNDGYLIPGEMKQKIFQPFYRLKETQAKAGSGIGLALSKSLTDLHNGKIFLNDSPQGTHLNIFTLSLPLYQPGANKKG